MLTSMFMTWLGTVCPSLLPYDTKVVRGLLQFTGMLKCRDALIVTLVFTVFGLPSRYSVSRLAVMTVIVFVVRSVV